MVARFASPSGVAVGLDGTIYVVDSGNCVIRKISAGGIVTTLAGQIGVSDWKDGQGTNALFNYPTASALDSEGNLYISDGGNYIIRKVTSAGLVTTIAGQPGTSGYRDGTGMNAWFSSIGGLAADSNNSLYVSDNFMVRKVSPAGIVTTIAGQPGYNGYQDGTSTNALFSYLNGIVVDVKGNIVVADSGNRCLRLISPAGEVSTFAGGGNWGYQDGQATNAWFSNLNGLSIDPEGNIYATDTGNSSIRKISPAGEVKTVGGGDWQPGAGWPYGAHIDGWGPFARFNSPAGVAVDPTGHLLVADGDGTVRYGGLAGESQPHLLRQPGNTNVQEGAAVILSAAAESASPMMFQWLFNGTVIPGATAASLLFNPVSATNAGEYRVAVSDGLGYVLSFPALLNVLDAKANSHSPLDHWHAVASQGLQDIQALAFGNNRYVAVGGADYWYTPPGDRGAIATSTDGQTWIKEPQLTPQSLNDVAFGNGRFVVVGNKGSVFTSTDGLEWQAQSLTAEAIPDLNGIAFDQGIFVAVSGNANGSIWTSVDGSNWTNRGVDFGVSFMTIEAAQGRFVAAGNTIMYSDDGLNWEPADSPTSFLGQEFLLEYLAKGNGTWLAAQGWGGGVAGSATGTEWQELTPTNSLSLGRVSFGNGTFLAVDFNTGGITTSAQGTDWTTPVQINIGERTVSSPHLVFDSGLFAATGDPGTLFTSPDGNAWSYHQQEQALPFVPNALLSSQGRLFAASQGVGLSMNGADWNVLLLTQYFSAFASGGGSIVAFGDRETIFSSADAGASWRDVSPRLNYGTNTPHIYRAAYGHGTFVFIGSLDDPNGTQCGHVLSSSNFVNWSTTDLAPGTYAQGIAFGNGAFMLLQNGSPAGSILSSTNGSWWKTVAVFPTNSLNWICFGNGRFVVLTGEGTVLTSSNGVTWTASSPPDQTWFSSITFGNGIFLATGNSLLWRSADAVAWEPCAAAELFSQYSTPTLTPGEGVFFALTADGMLYQSGPLEYLVNPRWLPNSYLEWTVSGAPGMNYRAEFSEDLMNWQTLAHATNAASISAFSDPQAATRPARFYRVITE